MSDGCQNYDKGQMSAEELKRMMGQAPSSFAAPTLLACPFCGNRPSLAKGRRRKNGDVLWSPQVSCKGCKIVRVGTTVEEVTTWWNLRAG